MSKRICLMVFLITLFALPASIAGLSDDPDPTNVQIIVSDPEPLLPHHNKVNAMLMSGGKLNFDRTQRIVTECTRGEQCYVPFGTLGIIAVPVSACDDAVDCAKAIKDSCAVTGDDADTFEFDRSRGKCEGKCSDGSDVIVVCP